jgi:hypothetical protein
MPRIITALLLLGSAAYPLAAQQLPQSFTSLRYASARDSAPGRLIQLELNRSEESPNYWAEGALIGGIPFALLGAGLAGWACGRDDGVDNGPCWDNELLGAVVGFGVGASLGALIGGQINKGKRTGEEPEPELAPAGPGAGDSLPRWRSR